MTRRWQITTKPIGRPAKDVVIPEERYHITAATAHVDSGHVVFRDADGNLVHVRALGTFVTVALDDD